MIPVDTLWDVYHKYFLVSSLFSEKLKKILGLSPNTAQKLFAFDSIISENTYMDQTVIITQFYDLFYSDAFLLRPVYPQNRPCFWSLEFSFLPATAYFLLLSMIYFLQV